MAKVINSDNFMLFQCKLSIILYVVIKEEAPMNSAHHSILVCWTKIIDLFVAVFTCQSTGPRQEAFLQDWQLLVPIGPWPGRSGPSQEA